MKPRNRFKRPKPGDALEDLDPDTMHAVRRAFRAMIYPMNRLKTRVRLRNGA